ncbi:hypothetical protein LTR28_000538 [Elasticomyces elasticus]|nr:hypothetical protein LTR28_000538 [Elasticomyces elasticus]
MSHTSSRVWKAPSVIEGEKWARNLKASRHLFRKSPFIPENLNRMAHQNAMKEAKEKLEERKNQSTNEDFLMEYMKRISEKSLTPAPQTSAKPFGGGHEECKTNHSKVLGLPTIWCEHWELGKEPGQIADWPCPQEMSYEGDDRVRTGLENRRFLPLPRVIGNQTVTWQQRSLVHTFPLDAVHPVVTEEDIFLGTYDITALVVPETDELHALGGELMAMLDPLDIW